jgi:ATP phosphoribosyltransferase
MAGYRISIEVDGKAEFDRVFKRTDLALSDLTEVWKEVRDEFWQIEKEQLESEGSAGKGGKYKRLSNKYAAEKAKKYPGTRILERTGAMYRAYTRKTSDSIVDIDKDGITIGAKGAVGARAALHQRGSGRLPKREVISFSERQKNRMMKRIQKTMLKEMRRQGVPVNG